MCEKWTSSTNHGPHDLTSVEGEEGHGWVVPEECPWLWGQGHFEEAGEVVRLFPQV